MPAVQFVQHIETYAMQVFRVKGETRRKIRLIEGIAKCCHLDKLTYKGTLWQVFICLPEPPPLTHCIRVYSILIHTGKVGELNQREG